MWQSAFLGIGSNVGDGVKNCKNALGFLASVPGISVETVSSFYSTSPVGYTEQEWFINCVAALKTALKPDDLLSVFLSAEETMGRKRERRWGRRVIDLDLLLYETQVLQSDFLTLPHPRMHERAFVMVPLLEIAPEQKHPVLERTIASLLPGISGQQVSRIDDI